jgi:hypothetical protein
MARFFVENMEMDGLYQGQYETLVLKFPSLDNFSIIWKY